MIDSIRNGTRLAFAGLLVAGLAGCAGGWRNGPPDGGAPAVAPPPASSGGTSGGASDPGNATFTWRGEAQSVHVAGEFNDWSTSADPLAESADGVWTLTKSLPAGRHQYKFVIDGTEWKEDPNATESADDGFGGKNSVVVVAAGADAGEPASKPSPPPVRPGETGGGDGVVFTWSGGANTVHLAGEFNEWSTSADPLEEVDANTWRITKSLPPGRYAYKFVIDGTEWKEDPNAAETVDDGFGGQNSVIEVTAGPSPTPAGGSPPPAATAMNAPPRKTEAGVAFTFVGPARTVHLVGEFNDWSTRSHAMTKNPDGSWSIVVPLEPGTYEYKFLVDGSRWQTDAANPNSAADGLGGMNSVITVE